MKQNTVKLMALTTLMAVSLMTGAHAEMMKDNMKMEMNMAKDGMMDTMNAPTAIGGFCPVCLIHGKMMKGSDQFTTLYNGKVYKFPSIEQQKMFVNDPEGYTKDIEMKYQQMGSK